MFAPKVEARLLQELGIRAHEHVLEIGTGSGYMAALAAHRAQQVLTVEIHPRLAAFGAANLRRNGVRNAHVESGDGSRGWAAKAPYDVIIVSGGLPMVPPELLVQLKIGGRLAAIVGEAPVMSAQIITRVTESAYDTLRLFETVAKPLVNALRPPRFRF
jgi:protein-L-isoaspartate(D-aspartate) O-methyltransferase